jgi:hypothetical protein
MRGWSIGVLSLLLFGCSAGNDMNGVEDSCSTGACADTGDPTGGEDDTTSVTKGDSGEDPPPDDGDTDGMDPPPPSGDRNGIPCDVAEALDRACGQCHGEQPAAGAPMALTTYEEFHVPAPSNPAQSTYEMVAERMADEAKPMPPAFNITDEDRATIDAWIASGAPEDPEADCGDTGGGEGDGVGPEYLPCDADYVIKAHASGSEEPFHVPAQGADDLYMCYAFKPNVTENVQAMAYAPIIDDARVVHHWILYRNQENRADGEVYPCDVGLQLSADFVAGWAPGGQNQVMPENVGLELMGPNDTFILQIHYHNTAQYTDALDKTGVAFCTLDQPREKAAGILTVGTIGLDIPAGAQMHPETGECGGLGTLLWPEPFHIISGSPHMHELGRAFSTELIRGGQSMGMVTDVPQFDFNSQLSYPNDPEIVVQPGDTLRSTCWFTNDTGQNVGFGEGTGDEMCFNFIFGYPIDMLPNRNCGIIF